MQKRYIRLFEDGSYQGPEYREEILNWSDVATLSNGLPVFREYIDSIPVYTPSGQNVINNGLIMSGDYYAVVSYAVQNKNDTEKLNWILEQRKNAYPDWRSLADAVYWEKAGDNSVMTAYVSGVSGVKVRYPKPS